MKSYLTIPAILILLSSPSAFAQAPSCIDVFRGAVAVSAAGVSMDLNAVIAQFNQSAQGSLKAEILISVSPGQGATQRRDAIASLLSAQNLQFTSVGSGIQIEAFSALEVIRIQTNVAPLSALVSEISGRLSRIDTTTPIPNRGALPNAGTTVDSIRTRRLMSREATLSLIERTVIEQYGNTFSAREYSELMTMLSGKYARVSMNDVIFFYDQIRSERQKLANARLGQAVNDIMIDGSAYVISMSDGKQLYVRLERNGHAFSAYSIRDSSSSSLSDFYDIGNPGIGMNIATTPGDYGSISPNRRRFTERNAEGRDVLRDEGITVSAQEVHPENGRLGNAINLRIELVNGRFTRVTLSRNDNFGGFSVLSWADALGGTGDITAINRVEFQ